MTWKRRQCCGFAGLYHPLVARTLSHQYTTATPLSLPATQTLIIGQKGPRKRDRWTEKRPQKKPTMKRGGTPKARISFRMRKTRLRRPHNTHRLTEITHIQRKNIFKKKKKRRRRRVERERERERWGLVPSPITVSNISHVQPHVALSTVKKSKNQKNI